MKNTVNPPPHIEFEKSTLKNKVDLIQASEVNPEPIEWLWNGWLAKGKLHLIAGIPGTGKTTIAIDIAAKISNGYNWPDNTSSRIGKTLIWSGEDGIKDTLLPRLIAHGADTKNVYFISTVDKENGTKRQFDPSTDIDSLEDRITNLENISLIIIDPIVSAIRKDSNKNSDVRAGLQPLIDLAIRYNIAIIGITHFSKGTIDRITMERVTGSLAFVAAARLVLVAIKDVTCLGRYIFAKAKSNICKDHGGLYYTLNEYVLDQNSEIRTSKIDWGAVIEGDTSVLLSQKPINLEKISELDEAREFLIEFLSDGDQLSDDVYEAGAASLISRATLKRAKKELGITKVSMGAKKPGKKFSWGWHLPQQGLKHKHESLWLK